MFLVVLKCIEKLEDQPPTSNEQSQSSQINCSCTHTSLYSCARKKVRHTHKHTTLSRSFADSSHFSLTSRSNFRVSIEKESFRTQKCILRKKRSEKSHIRYSNDSYTSKFSNRLHLKRWFILEF